MTGVTVDALWEIAAPEFSERWVKLTHLPELPGTEVPARLARSVEQFGVVQPVIVRQIGGGEYIVVDGRRRIASARALGHKRIRARVFTDDGVTPDALTITLNAARGQNVLAELEAIERLVAEGLDEKTIAATTGMPVGTVRARLRLAALVPELREGLRDGRMAPGTAERAARLPAASQTAIVEQAGPEGRMSASMVRKAAEVRRDEVLTGLQLPEPVAPDWRDVVRSALAFALEHIPQDQERLRSELGVALDVMDQEAPLAHEPAF